jgi:tetratricopeptide (TPR) repeat protein
VLFKYHYHRREYQKALEALQRMNLVEMPYYWFWLAAVYGQLGRRDQANEAILKLHELDPKFVEQPWEQAFRAMHVEEWVEHFIDGLRKAGLDVPPRPA